MGDPFIAVYPEPGVIFERGSGVYLFDTSGRRYLDFLAGIAVVSLGHSNPGVTRALQAQLAKLGHVSNYFRTPPQIEAAEALTSRFDFECQVFFVNSGTEANEAAIKLIRRARPSRRKIVTFAGGFHGRTMGSLSATGWGDRNQPFAPLLPGVITIPFNDPGALKSAVQDPEVGGILFEAIQGEAGVRPMSRELAETVKEVARECDLLVAVDEVQAGLGRTGRWFGYQHYGLEPDIIALAKALGNGFPVGAMVARNEVASAFKTGDHGSTFGGNPLAGTAIVAVLDGLDSLLAPERAGLLGAELMQMVGKLPLVKAVEGMGLMIGVELTLPLAPKVYRRALELGLVINYTSPTRLRLLPPLVISTEEIDAGVQILGEAISSTGGEL